MDNQTIPNGLYVHYKTNTTYRVIGEVLDTDLQDVKVLYEDTSYGDKYTRSLTSWLEPVFMNGQQIERFRRIGD